MQDDPRYRDPLTVLSLELSLESPGIEDSENIAYRCLAALTRVGYMVVPVSPTNAMIHAGDHTGGGAGMTSQTPVTEKVWDAMLRAARSPKEREPR